MFKDVLSFNGRIRRTEYAITYIIVLVVEVSLDLLINTDGYFESLLKLAFLIPILWFSLAQGSKRCHDRGNSGLYQLIPFYILWMLFGDSDYGRNRYGTNPKGEGNNEEIEQIGKPEN